VDVVERRAQLARDGRGGVVDLDQQVLAGVRRRSWIGARPWTIALVTISDTSRIASRASDSAAPLVQRRAR
jgi:hypothetical protein